MAIPGTLGTTIRAKNNLMKKELLTALIISVTIICSGQTSHTRFFRDSELTREVAERRANYSETVTKHADGTVTTEIKDLNQNEVILRNGEPFGTWTVTNKKVNLNYNFELVYTEEICTETYPDFRPMDYFEKHENIGYTPPIIANGEPNMVQYLVNNLYYPAKARENRIMGTVNFVLTINKQAQIENLAIYDSADILLDKEAMRVLRELRFSQPPKLNGEPIEVCILFPIRFILN